MVENQAKKSMLDAIRGELAKEKENETVHEEIQVDEVNKKTLKNRERRQKKKLQKNGKVLENKDSVKIETVSPIEQGVADEKIRLFREKYIEREVNKEFLNLLELANSTNDEAFPEKDFLEAKIINASSRVVVLDPSTDDLALGKGYKWFLVRPLYVTEYMDFVKKFGPRESKPQEFLEFCFKKCLILPKMDDKQKEEIPSGTILTLYRTILDISDFNKKYRIIEV